MKVRHLTLRVQITLLVGLLSLVLVCASAVGAAYIAQARTRQIVFDDAAKTAASLAAVLDQGMFERYREMRNLAGLLPAAEIWTGPRERLRQALEQLQTSFPHYAWIGFTDAAGTVRAATLGMLEGQSVAARPWFQAGRTGPMVGDVHEAKLLASLLGPGPNNEPFRFVDVAAPVRDLDGNLLGVLGAHLSWTWAEERRRALLAQPGRLREESIWVLAGDGTVLLGPKIGHKPFSDERIRDMLYQGTGVFEDSTGAEPMLTGFSVARGYRDYPGLSWIVVSLQPESAAFAAGRSVAWTILGLGGAVALFGLVCALMIARRVSRPLKTIIDAADRIGRDPDIALLPRIGGSAEIVRLSGALRSLLRRAGAAEQRMSEASSQYARDLSTLRQLSETDALSGLLNRRGFSLLGDDAFAHFTRYGRGFAVLIVDIDFFKGVNDTYGHAAGDAVIRTVGSALTGTLRPTDKVARFGGEEFVVIVRDVGSEAIQAVAQKVRRAVETASTTHQGHVIAVTASVGGAMVQGTDRDIQDVIERADTALYEAKAAGRNRVVLDGMQPRLAATAA